MQTQEILEKLVSFPVLGGQSNLDLLEWNKTLLKTKVLP